MSQGPQATFGVRCTQLAPKHGGRRTAQIESNPPFFPLLAPTLLVSFFFLLPKKGEKNLEWLAEGTVGAVCQAGLKRNLHPSG